MKIFFDLDGTVIDSKLRLYMLFQKLVIESKLTYNQYWELKKNNLKHVEILRKMFEYSNEQISKFEFEWMNLIESSEMLDFDSCFEYTNDILDYLSQRAELFIVTDRQFGDRVLVQLKKLEIFSYFTDILVTEQKIDKSKLIILNENVTSDDYFVGDTGKDIMVGHTIGIKTIAVLSGFMSKDKLLNYNPDILVENIGKLRDFI